MLYLAQVQRDPTSGKLGLRLLACQKSDRVWDVDKSDFLLVDQEDLSEGLLVLVEVCENFQVIQLQEAKDWVIELMDRYLTTQAITPEFINAEKARLEQWRQELTSQSQDLTRQRLEMETRREQLQELEASLKLEREKLQLDTNQE